MCNPLISDVILWEVSIPVMWCYVWNGNVFIVFWLHLQKEVQYRSITFLNVAYMQTTRVIYIMLVFVRIYVSVKNIEKGNIDWKYVANTIDPLTSKLS